MDDFINQFVEDLTIDALFIWADILGVEINPPPLDDMYPDFDNELRIEVAEELVNVLSQTRKRQ